jgi:hypothetical protein
LVLGKVEVAETFCGGGGVDVGLLGELLLTGLRGGFDFRLVQRRFTFSRFRDGSGCLFPWGDARRVYPSISAAELRSSSASAMSDEGIAAVGGGSVLVVPGACGALPTLTCKAVADVCLSR